ncbi:hypothetical protein D3C78_1883840 [compost metagenome]
MRGSFQHLARIQPPVCCIPVWLRCERQLTVEFSMAIDQQSIVSTTAIYLQQQLPILALLIEAGDLDLS